jgi:CheY-like chemotaxis protein
MTNAEMVLAQSETPLAGLRCLVLDDEMLIALDIQQILEAAGAAFVACVGNAAEALMALNVKPGFDLAVLDVMLSGAIGNSHAVADALLAQRIPFVFLTGLRAEDLRRTARFPAASVVEKPYQAPVLLEAITRALATRQPK